VRLLTPTLNAAMLDERRQPAWKILVYDVRSTTDTINNLVRGDALLALTGPRDFTKDVLVATLEEVAGDFNGDGVAASSLSLTISDPLGKFDPLLTLVAPTGDGRWLRDGNVVRVLEGDARVPEADWVTTFTGELVGQAGVRRGRVARASEITMDAVDRAARFLRFPVTSDTFGIGSTLLTIGTLIAQTDMALDSSEILLGGWGAQVTGHFSTQFVEEPPLVALAHLMFPDGFMPRFTGAGKLAQTSGIITKAPARSYPDSDLIQDIERPKHRIKAKNRVTVRGLSATMTKITQPFQKLAEVNITTGFFARDEEIRVTWSEDETKLVQNTRMKVLRSINGGLLDFAATETYTEEPKSPEGSVAGTIEVGTGFAPYIIVFFTGIYIGMQAIPRPVVAPGGSGFTIPVQDVIAAAALSVVMLLMSQIGRGQYQIEGEPFEYVFQEIVGTAQVQGLSEDEVNVLDISNHLIQTQAVADTTAQNVLRREVAKANVRAVTMLVDLLLEPDDVFELAAESRKFMIRSQSRTLRRGADAVVAVLDCFEVTPGLVP
jgi:hypothetical protein